MSAHRKILLKENGALTERAIKAYLEGKLPEEQLAEFKMILADDPFAAEAIEGYQSAVNLESALHTAAKVKETIKSKTGAGKANITSIQIHWPMLAYAAAFIGLIVGVGLVFKMYRDSSQSGQLAVVEAEDDSIVSEPTPEFRSAEPLADSSVFTAITDTLSFTPSETANGDDAVSYDAETPATEQTAAANLRKTESKPEEKKETTKEKAAEVAAAKPATTTTLKVLADKAEQQKKQDPKKTDAAAKKQPTAPAPAAAGAAANAVAEEKNAEGANEFDKAMKLFNAGDYKSASTLFEEISTKNPENSEATYFSGVCYYINGNRATAEQKFDKLLKRGSYVDGSKWYKANILLGSGKKDEAVKILNELTGTSGVFKDRAVKKLADLEKK